MTVVVDVRALRERLAWSKEEFADRMGVTPFEISFLEHRGYVSDRMAERLAAVVRPTQRRAPMTGSRLRFRTGADLRELGGVTEMSQAEDAQHS